MPRLLVLTLCLVVSGCTLFRSTPRAETPAPAAPSAERRGSSEPKSYADVTKDAVADSGLFVIHRTKDDKLLYEIPDSLLTREMLLVSRIRRAALGTGYGGIETNDQVVRWEQQGKNILLRSVSYTLVAADSLPVYTAVRNAQFEPVLASFPIAAYNADSSAVVLDVTSLFTTDVPALGLDSFSREQLRVRRLDPARTYVSGARSFPQNVEVQHVLTYDAASPAANASTGTVSMEMNQSMVLLPRTPMKPRLFDQRVAYFTRRQVDFGRAENQAVERRYAVRWRLEPSDPAAYARGELVEPVKPIVYYLDEGWPAQWRPYACQGVEDWQVAFEAAGFKNAIQCRYAPTPEEDPEFSPEDVRYSVMRYFPSETENAFGPNVHDPRSGEILDADIGWFHNVMNLLRHWYFVQTAAANPAARPVQLPDTEMGELIRFVSAHEVGHTLGLPHNFVSSAAVPVDSLRSPSYTAKNGTAPSIMDYARFNYIAQPGDGVTQFFPKVGAYDKWSIKWGYTWLPQARTPDDEKAILDRWVTPVQDDLTYRFGIQRSVAYDPRMQREDLGADPLAASQLGIDNLKVITANLVDWTEVPGATYDDLEERYGRILGQLNLYIDHVTALVGGVYEDYKTYDQEGPVYTPVPAARQQAAVAFLHAQVFERPDWLLDTDVLRRFERTGTIERIRRLQVGALADLLSPWRMARLLENEVVDQNQPYPLAAFLADVRTGLWRELGAGATIDPYRRNLQRAYLAQLQAVMEEEPSTPSGSAGDFIGYSPINVAQSDLRPLVRGELADLQTQIQRTLRTRRLDRTTRLHLEDADARIEQILNPED